MISTFDIKGFKSIRNLHLDCRRINLFIGEPNTGKSNILEALGFLSWCRYDGGLRQYVRFEQVSDLFFDGIVEKDCWQLKIGGTTPMEVVAGYEGQGFRFDTHKPDVVFRLDHQGNDFTQRRLTDADFIKFYRFTPLAVFTSPYLGFLSVPNGDNLTALTYSSKELRQLAADYFAPYGLQLVIKPHEHKFEVQKQADGVGVSFPYHLTSDTLQRMIFHTVAIESNKESTLVFEEPETHAFPYFTKHLGERIALDENRNQYFIATHNPYLLFAILEKAPAADVAVFVTSYRQYETKAKLLTATELDRLQDADPFLSLDELTEGE